VAPQLASGAPETGASEQGGEEGGRLLSGRVTIEGKRSWDESEGGIGCFIAAMPDLEERSRMQFGRPLHR
jgi:hypothetical protein